MRQEKLDQTILADQDQTLNDDQENEDLTNEVRKRYQQQQTKVKHEQAYTQLPKDKLLMIDGLLK